MGKTVFSLEQAAWLQCKVPAFVRAKEANDTAHFVLEAKREFEAKFCCNLSDESEPASSHEASIWKRKDFKRLYDFFNNHSRESNMGHGGSLELEEKSKRAAPEYAVFNQLFGVALNLGARAAQLRAAAPPAEQYLDKPNVVPIKFRNQAAKEAYANATEVQRLAVKRELANKAAQRKLEDEQRENLTHEQKLQNALKLTGPATKLMDGVYKMCGVKSIIIFGGENPTAPGELGIQAFSSDQVNSKFLLSPQWKKIKQLATQWLRTEFPDLRDPDVDEDAWPLPTPTGSSSRSITPAAVAACAPTLHMTGMYTIPASPDPTPPPAAPPAVPPPETEVPATPSPAQLSPALPLEDAPTAVPASGVPATPTDSPLPRRTRSPSLPHPTLPTLPCSPPSSSPLLPLLSAHPSLPPPPVVVPEAGVQATAPVPGMAAALAPVDISPNPDVPAHTEHDAEDDAEPINQDVVPIGAPESVSHSKKRPAAPRQAAAKKARTDQTTEETTRRGVRTRRPAAARATTPTTVVAVPPKPKKGGKGKRDQ